MRFTVLPISSDKSIRAALRNQQANTPRWHRTDHATLFNHEVVVAMDETAVASPHDRGSNFSPGKGVRPSSSPLRGGAWGASAVNGAPRGPIVGTVISSV